MPREVIRRRWSPRIRKPEAPSLFVRFVPRGVTPGWQRRPCSRLAIPSPLVYRPRVALCGYRINKKCRVVPTRRRRGCSGDGECDMKLNELSDNDGATRKKKRVARGPGSGKGKTAGRGIKGQKSRSGVALGGYEGGQMPLYRRLPKRGFTKPNRMEYAVVNLGLIEKFIGMGKLDAKSEITEDVLVAAGLTNHKRDGIRVLNKGAFTSKITLVVSGASAAAVDAVTAAGGTLTVKAPRPAAAE